MIPEKENRSLWRATHVGQVRASAGHKFPPDEKARLPADLVAGIKCNAEAGPGGTTQFGRSRVRHLRRGKKARQGGTVKWREPQSEAQSKMSTDLPLFAGRLGQ